jgi:hypothetical protein
VIILGGRRQTLDGEIHARGLLASELAIVQVCFVHDLRDHGRLAEPRTGGLMSTIRQPIRSSISRHGSKASPPRQLLSDGLGQTAS